MAVPRKKEDRPLDLVDGESIPEPSYVFDHEYLGGQQPSEPSAPSNDSAIHLSLKRLEKFCNLDPIEEKITDEEGKVSAALDEIASALGSIFTKYQIASDRRPALLNAMTERLIEKEKGESRNSWVQRIASDSDTVTIDIRPFKTIALPKKAPALWRRDRLDEESVVEFIERIYGETGLNVLRSDGTGMRRTDLLKLDPALRNPINDYLAQHSTWPKSCPLPLKHEITDIYADALQPLMSEDMAPVRDKIRKALTALSSRESRAR